MVVGTNVTVFHRVIITNNGSEIGDYMLIGAGAMILSWVKIGHHSKIASNAVVVEDVLPCPIVMLQKPRVIVKLR